MDDIDVCDFCGAPYDVCSRCAEQICDCDAGQHECCAHGVIDEPDDEDGDWEEEA